MTGLGLDISPGGLVLRRGGAGASAPASLPVAPASRWHPQFSATATSAGRVTSAADLTGLALATEGAAGQGPLALTDAAGRKFWRFKGSEFLDVATGLGGASRSFAMFMVARIHIGGSFNLFSLGSVKAGTAGGSGNVMLDISPNSRAPILRAAGRAATVDTINWHHMIPGSQLCVIGANCRATADGGVILYLDGIRTTTLGQSGVAGTFTGGEIGRNSQSPGSAGVNSTWAKMDLYEAVAYSTHLTDGDADAVQAALAAAWGITTPVNQLVIEGDSISSYSAEGDFGDNVSMILTDPGAPLAAGWRVVTVASPGNTLATLVGRRDQANGWAVAKLSGQNVLAFEVGANDLGASMPAATYRASLVAYLNTTTTGVLQRGWTVRQLANIATTNPARQTEILALRPMLRHADYLTDTLTGPGQTHEGLLSILDTDLIEVGGDPVFATLADAAVTTFYYDGLHPTPAGQIARVLGGDDPARGIAYGLA